jgi:hypothetical protein
LVLPPTSRARHDTLINTIACMAEAKSYDRATELEMAGATVLDLKPTEWRDLALAA